VKNIVLSLSLISNGLVAYFILNPATTLAVKMTCDQVRNEGANKAATLAFALANGGSLSKTHDFLRNSDFYLRNIHIADGKSTFVYTASNYPSTCGFYGPVVDGGIVRIGTNLGNDPLIAGIW